MTLTEDIKPKEQIIYYEGHLAEDCDKGHGAALMARNISTALYRHGHVELTQRRSGTIFKYIATGKSYPRYPVKRTYNKDGN